jgi:hypothetical protein
VVEILSHILRNENRLRIVKNMVQRVSERNWRKQHDELNEQLALL